MFSRLALLTVASALVAAASASSPIYYAYAGQSCGTSTTKCRSHLVCESKVCKVKEGGGCLGRESLCATNLVCAGKKSGKKCAYPTIPKGGDCLAYPNRCAPGLVCAGNKHKKTCVWPVGPGGWCRNPFWPCKSGLFCQNKVCKTPLNGDCKPSGSVCTHGLVCAGKTHKRRCVKPVYLGGECGRFPLQVCRAGLRCRKYRCSSPRIPEGGSCLPAGSKCKRGLVCAGNKFDKRCVSTSGERGPCGSLFEVCESGLYCSRGKCKNGQGQLGSRCRPNRPCARQFVCSGIPLGGLRTVCALERGAGESCGEEFICKSGLKCKGRFCAY